MRFDTSKKRTTWQFSILGRGKNYKAKEESENVYFKLRRLGNKLSYDLCAAWITSSTVYSD